MGGDGTTSKVEGATTSPTFIVQEGQNDNKAIISEQRIVVQQHVVVVPSHKGNMTAADNLNNPKVNGDEEDSGDHCRNLSFALFACQDSAPYGPPKHIASLFLKIICRALRATHNTAKAVTTTHQNSSSWDVKISVYNAIQFDYPASQDEWDSYDGFLLPGSLSGAYETKDWILKLSNVIATEIHGKGRKSLGVCFGHQLYAHSFRPHGLTIKCPAGFQAGRKTVTLTPEGSFLLGSAGTAANRDDSGKKYKENHLHSLLYTHGDMVQKLPPCAVSLGGTEPKVPIQIVAYFQTEEEAAQFQRFVRENDEGKIQESSTITTTRKPPTLPIAITFQAHPEYANRKYGVESTFGGILRKVLSDDELKAAEQDVIDNFDTIEDQSTNVMVRVGAWLGWWGE